MAYLDLSPALTPTITTPLGRHCLGNHWFLYEFDTQIKFWMIFGVPHGSRNSRMVMEWCVYSSISSLSPRSGDSLNSFPLFR